MTPRQTKLSKVTGSCYLSQVKRGLFPYRRNSKNMESIPLCLDSPHFCLSFPSFTGLTPWGAQNTERCISALSCCTGTDGIVFPKSRLTALQPGSRLTHERCLQPAQEDGWEGKWRGFGKLGHRHWGTAESLDPDHSCPRIKGWLRSRIQVWAHLSLVCWLS